MTGRRWTITMTTEQLGAVITALAFCLAGVEIFVDEDGHNDDSQIAAAQKLLDRLSKRVTP